MGHNLPALLRGALKLLAVVVASGVVGAGLGLGLSEVRGNSGGETPPFSPPADTAPASAPAGTTGATGSSTGAAAEKQNVKLKVLSATLKPATTPSGISRNRARVTVRLKATAGSARVKLASPTLASREDEVPADPASADPASAAAGLLDPIPAGKSVTGELQYEVSGALTDRLTTRKRAVLRVGGRRLPFRLTAP